MGNGTRGVHGAKKTLKKICWKKTWEKSVLAAKERDKIEGLGEEECAEDKR